MGLNCYCTNGRKVWKLLHGTKGKSLSRPVDKTDLNSCCWLRSNLLSGLIHLATQFSPTFILFMSSQFSFSCAVLFFTTLLGRVHSMVLKVVCCFVFVLPISFSIFNTGPTLRPTGFARPTGFLQFSLDSPSGSVFELHSVMSERTQSPWQLTICSVLWAGRPSWRWSMNEMDFFCFWFVPRRHHTAAAASLLDCSTTEGDFYWLHSHRDSTGY